MEFECPVAKATNSTTINLTISERMDSIVIPPSVEADFFRAFNFTYTQIYQDGWIAVRS